MATLDEARGRLTTLIWHAAVQMHVEVRIVAVHRERDVESLCERGGFDALRVPAASQDVIRSLFDNTTADVAVATTPNLELLPSRRSIRPAGDDKANIGCVRAAWRDLRSCSNGGTYIYFLTEERLTTTSGVELDTELLQDVLQHKRRI